MTTTALIIGGLIMSAAGILFGLALCRAAARADRMARRAHVDYLMRYTGGENICRTCGEPTYYSDKRGPVHPGACREAS